MMLAEPSFSWLKPSARVSGVSPSEKTVQALAAEAEKSGDFERKAILNVVQPPALSLFFLTAERQPDNFVSTAPDTEFGSSLTAFVQGLTVSLIETPRLATFAARAYFADDHPAGVNTDLIRSTLGAMFANKINMDGTLLDRLAIGELVADVWAASLLALVQNRISLPKALIRVGAAITLIEKHASLSSPLGE